MTKAERAATLYQAIIAALDAGRTVYLATALRVTKLTKKHRDMVRLNGNSLEVQHGRKWLDYTYTSVSAR